MLAVVSYDPLVHVDIGPLSVSPHGVAIAVGFMLGARLMLPEAIRKGIAEDDAYALLVRAAVGSIIGARLAYVANHLGDYDSVLDVLKVWEGGISLLGGFFGAILVAMPGAAASICFQNETPLLRISGMASRMAPKKPPSSEMPPSHTFSTSTSDS